MVSSSLEWLPQPHKREAVVTRVSLQTENAQWRDDDVLDGGYKCRERLGDDVGDDADQEPLEVVPTPLTVTGQHESH